MSSLTQPPITEAQADELLGADLTTSYGPAIDALGLQLNQNQFDATCSFVYQLGVGVLGPSDTFGSYLRASDWTGAADALLLYDTAGGAVVPELSSRRALKRALFLAPPPPEASPSSVLTRTERELADSYEHALHGPSRDAASVTRLRDELGVQREHVWLGAVRGQEPDGTPTEPGWAAAASRAALRRARAAERLAELRM